MPLPAFNVTLDNPHPIAASSAAYRPITVPMPWPEDGSWTDDTSGKLRVTHGSQTGTATLGALFGAAYRDLHIRGITIPADGHLTGVLVTPDASATPPAFAGSADGIALITGVNALWLHVGGEIVSNITWTQVRNDAACHKWTAFVFEPVYGLSAKLWAYAWPGLNRVELLVQTTWHDERTQAMQRTIPSIGISVQVVNEIRAEFAAGKNFITTRETIGGGPRTVCWLSRTPVTLGDGQGPDARMAILVAGSSTAERDDFLNSLVWPVKGTCDPDVWRGRIGPYRHISGHDGFWPVGSQWGDGGSLARDRLWNSTDARYGFKARLASYETSSPSFFSFRQYAKIGGQNGGISGGRNSYGNSFLPFILGIRGGNPRTLLEFAFDGLWETSMRPIKFGKWVDEQPTAENWVIGDSPYGYSAGGTYLYAQRLDYGSTRGNASLKTWGKSPGDSQWYNYPPEIFLYTRDSLAGVSGYPSSHHEVAMIGALAILDDCRDLWTDWLEINAGLYPHNERNIDSSVSATRNGQYRSGRAELSMAWAFETASEDTRDGLLDFWEARFNRNGTTYRTDDGGGNSFWTHVARGDAWETWGSDASLNQGQLLNRYHTTWHITRGLPGYELAARLIAKYRENEDGMEFCARQARHHLRHEWRAISEQWEPVYFIHYPGRRSDVNESALEGTIPPESWYSDPTRVKMREAGGAAVRWWLGAVQAAVRLVRDFFSDETLALKGEEIARRVALDAPRYDGATNDEQESAHFLEIERMASDEIPMQVAAVVLLVPEEGLEASEGTPTITNPGMLLVASSEGLEMGEDDAEIQQEPVFGIDPVVLIVGSEAVYVGEAALTVSLEVELTVPLGPTEDEQDGLSVGEFDAFIINGAQVRLNVPSEGIAVGDDTATFIVRTLVVALEGLAVAEGQARRHGIELLVQPDGSIVGEPGASIVGYVQREYTDVQGVFEAEYFITGGWGVTRLDQGLTIIAGDGKPFRCDVRDKAGAVVDCSSASNAEFAVVIEDVQVLYRSLGNGIDCSSGQPIVDLGNTAELDDGVGEYVLRLSLGGTVETVVRSPVRILRNVLVPQGAGL